MFSVVLKYNCEVHIIHLKSIKIRLHLCVPGSICVKHAVSDNYYNQTYITVNAV